MDAKSKADFINSVVSGVLVTCPKCGTNIKPDRKFCGTCGTKIIFTQEAQNNIPALEPEKEIPDKIVKEVVPNNVFAHGLPNWSIEPPLVMVRRR